MGQEAKILTGWQEVAAYLGKGVRTVQRWEQVLGVPVRRPIKAGHGGVVEASTEELDEWLETAWAQRGIEIYEKLRRSFDDEKRFRETNRELGDGVARALNSLKDSRERLEFNIGELVRTDLEMGITLASLALSSKTEETPHSHCTNARKVYDTARQFLKKHPLREPTVQRSMLASLTTLKNLLLQLGEALEE